VKLIKLICCVICCILMCSCRKTSSGNVESSKYNPSDLYANDYNYAKEVALKVIGCLENEDKAAFKNMLSDTALRLNDVEEQIDTLFEFCKEHNLSCDVIKSDIASSKRQNKTYTYKSIRIVVENALQNDNGLYDLEFFYVLVDDSNSKSIGVSQMYFIEENGRDILRFFEKDN